MSTVGEYLPPLVTKLLGDSSDVVTSFAEATAAERAFERATADMGTGVSKTYRKTGRSADDFTDLVVNRARKGETAVATLRREMARTEEQVTRLRREMGRTVDHGLYDELRHANNELTRMRNLAKVVAPELLAGVRTLGQRTGIEFAGAFAGASGMLIPAIIAALVVASPAIAGLIGSAVAVGLGLGFAGLGTVIAAMLIPQVRRAFATIGSSFQGALRFAVQGAFRVGLLDGLSIFNRMIPTFGRQLRSIFDALAPALAPLAAALGEGLKGFLAETMQMIPQLMPALLTFIGTIPDVMRAVAEFLVAITADGPALSRFITDAANAIVSFLHGAGAVIAWLEHAYLWVVRLNDKFPFIGWGGKLEALGMGLQAVGRWFVDLWGKIVSGAKAVGSWFAGLGTAIWSWMTDAGSAIAAWFTGVVDWFAQLPGRVGAYLAALPGRIVDWLSRAAHAAFYWSGFLVGRVVRFFAELPGRIATWVSAVWAFVTNAFRVGVTAAVEFTRALPGKIAEYFAYLWSAVTGWVSRTWTSVVSWFVRTKQSMIEHVAAAITAVIGFFKSLPGRAAAEAGNFKDRLIKFFAGAKTWLVEAGKNIVRGVVQGISDMWDWAVGKVKGFGHDLAKGFRDALRFGSPSKVFADFGQNIVAGLVQGVDRDAWKAVNAVSGMLGGARPAFAYAGAGVSPTMAAAMTTPNRGAAYGGPTMVATDVYIDGQKVVSALTPPAQRRKKRSGVTGMA